jgi:hypothetical protein
MMTLMLTFVFLMAFGSVAFIAWIILVALRAWLDHREQNARRIRNRDLTAHCVTPKFNLKDWK